MAPGNQPLLLVFAHGADLATLTALRHSLGGAPWQTIPALQVPADPIGYTLREGSAAESLRDLGIATDRRSLQLRGHRTDEEVIARLGARGMGPAPVTMLELTSVLDRARHCGPPTPAEAAAMLGEPLHHAIRNLRAGDPPEPWLVGLGAVEAVHTQFDVLGAVRRRVVHPLTRELRFHLTEAELSIQATNQRALRQAAVIFGAAPFAAYGRVVQTGPARLAYHANQGIALGVGRQLARAAHQASPAVTAAAVRPQLHDGGSPATFHELLASFWMRAAHLHAQPDVAIADRELSRCTPDARSTARTAEALQSPPGWTASPAADQTAPSRTESEWSPSTSP